MDSESLLVNGLCTIAGGIVGWFTCIFLSQHPAMLNLRAERADRKAERMNSTEPKPRRTDRYGLAIIVFLIALLVISSQAYLNQRAESPAEPGRTREPGPVDRVCLLHLRMGTAVGEDRQEARTGQ